MNGMTRECIVTSIKAWLEKMKWQYNFDSNKSTFKMGVYIGGALSKVRVAIPVRNDSYLVYVVSYIGCAENKQNAIWFLTMANYGLINGNFEVDVRDGEIRYKTYVNCIGMETLPEQVISDSVMCACRTFRKYSSGIVQLCLNKENATPESEIKRCEGNV